jgi:hypothetical protein
MFYKKEDVIARMTCALCSKIYNDPRILPCGDSACYECILDSIQRNQDNQFKCAFCEDIHHPCEFVSNKSLVKSIQIIQEKAAQEVEVMSPEFLLMLKNVR